MRKLTTILMFIGYIFVVVDYQMPGNGFDVLLDAVGYLMIWNGLRYLRRQDNVFETAPLLALLLIFITAVQELTYGSVYGLILTMLRPTLEIVLVWYLSRGFRAINKKDEHPRMYKAWWVIGLLAMGSHLGELMYVILEFFYGLGGEWYMLPMALFVLAAQVCLIVMLAVQAIMFWREEKASPAAS